MRCISLPEIWGEDDDYLDEFKKVFTKIAITSVGKQNAANITDKAIFEVVGREVVYHLVKNSGNEWKTYLGVDEAIVEEVSKMVYNDWQYKLNTILHVEVDPLSKVDRGAVLKGTNAIFKNLLGKELDEWYLEEFQWTKHDKDEFEIVPIAVEISPSCDYAQGNPRLYRYVLGICWMSKKQPSNNIEKGKTSPFKNKNSHKNLPTFYINNKFYKICLSYNYVVGLKQGAVNRLKLLFTMRDEIVTQISSLVADHNSRIGLIDVNEV